MESSSSSSSDDEYNQNGSGQSMHLTVKLMKAFEKRCQTTKERRKKRSCASNNKYCVIYYYAMSIWHKQSSNMSFLHIAARYSFIHSFIVLVLFPHCSQFSASCSLSSFLLLLLSVYVDNDFDMNNGIFIFHLFMGYVIIISDYEYGIMYNVNECSGSIIAISYIEMGSHL